MWRFQQSMPYAIHGIIGIVAYFFRVGLYVPLVYAGKHMVYFMLGKAVVENCFVGKAESLLQAGFKAHFFLQPAHCGMGSVFAGQGMTAAGIGPQTAAMVFMSSSLLQQHFAIGIKNKNTECPVQQPLPVGLHFIHSAYWLIGFIN